MALFDPIKKLPDTLKLILIGGLAVLLFIGFLRYGGRFSNGIGNWIFHRQINAKQQEVQKELDNAAAMKEQLKQTLLDYEKSKADLAVAQEQRKQAEQLFYDQSKTSAEKVAEYKKALADTPTHTDASGVTIDDLCARAKASNSNPALIAALCGQ